MGYSFYNHGPIHVNTYTEAREVNIQNNDFIDPHGFFAICLDSGIYTFLPFNNDDENDGVGYLTAKQNATELFGLHGNTLLLKGIKATKDNNKQKFILLKSGR